jgi:hypothetical protein
MDTEATNNNRAELARFKSVGADGTHWLLVVRPHDGWAIMRDGKRFAVRTGKRASIDSAVRRFLSLTVTRESQVTGNPHWA